MNNSIILSALVTIAVALVSWWCVGKLKVSLLNRSIVDRPNERTLHHGAVPRGGGLVFIMFLVFALLLASVFSGRPQTFLMFAFLVGSWAGLSWWDDRTSLSPRTRLMIQSLIMAITILAFGWVTEIIVSKTATLYLGGVGLLASAIGLLWFANLYNFMDGIDGLAASQTIIAALTFSFWFWIAGDIWLAGICLTLAASTYGFLLHNWHPASVFMGDVGSISVGAFFATLIIYASNRYQIPVICSVLLFGVFVSDASLTIIRRMLKREKIWLPHRSHYYQRAAALGFNHSHITITLAVLMIVTALLASYAVADRDRIAIATLSSAALIAAPMFFVHWMENRRSKNDSEIEQ